MRPGLPAARVGAGRGLIELRHSMTSTQDLGYWVVINAALVLVLLLQRGTSLAGTPFSLAAATLPSLLGVGVVAGGLMGVASRLSTDREDGTLLRAKATPHGMAGYLVARIVHTSLDAGLGVAILLAAGLLLLDGPRAVGAAGWLTLLGVLALGLLATLPWGGVIGSLVRSPNSGFGLTFLLVGGLVGISGIFYPVTALAGWLQGIAQVFPLYWLGHGTRAALLPDAAAAAELDGSWRLLPAFGILAAWAVAGLLVAPPVLRRMARRESGSTMETRKQRALQRGY